MNRKQVLIASLLASITVGMAVFALLRSPPDTSLSSIREEMRPNARVGAQAISATSSYVAKNTNSPRAPLPDTPLAAVLDQLKAKALAGDPRAACRIAQAIHRCKNAINSLDTAEILSRVPKFPGQDETLADALLRQGEGNVVFCANVDSDALNAYRYQRIAASHGGAAYERWIVTLPALDQQDFLSQLDDWKDYRDRAKDYFDRSLAQRNGDDLALLVTVYAPRNPTMIRPPYRVDDNMTFLALYEIARRNGVFLPTQLAQMADELKAGISREEGRKVNTRLLELDGSWRVKKPGRLPHEDLVETGGEAFCR